MSNNTATKAPLEEKYNDYEKTPVPETARQTWYQQGMVWLGAGFGLSGLATGGVLADGAEVCDALAPVKHEPLRMLQQGRGRTAAGVFHDEPVNFCIRPGGPAGK